MAELSALLSAYREEALALKSAIAEEKIEEIELRIAAIAELNGQIALFSKSHFPKDVPSREIAIAEENETIVRESISALKKLMQSRFEKWQKLSGAISALKEYQQKRGNSSYFIDSKE